MKLSEEFEVSCDGCQTILNDPEDIVVGYWDGDCFIAEGNDRDSAAYCLTCAPCECDDHEKYVPHTAENIEKKGVSV